jgi:hypothetical protein
VEKDVVFGKEYIKCGERSGIWKGIYMRRNKLYLERNT